MSIRLMTRIWQASKHKGSNLLTLLALADWADDDGTGIYPSMESIAQKTRLTRRQAARITRELEDSGVLAWTGKKTTYGVRVYNILPDLIGDEKITHVKITRVKITDDTGDRGGDDKMSQRYDTGDRGGMSPMSSNPSSDPSSDPSLVIRERGASAPLTPPTDRMNQPAPPRKARRKTEDPNRDTPPVKVFYDVFERWPTKAQSEMMAELVSDLPRWREICKLWAVNEWDDHRVHNIIDRYQKSFSENGKSKPAARGKTFRRQPATFTDEQREASRRAAAYNVQRRAYCQAHGLDPRKDSIDRAAVEAWVGGGK